MNRVWPDEVFFVWWRGQQKVTVQGKLVYYPERIYHAPDPPVASRYKEGDTIPGSYHLLKWEIVKQVD
ncbi:MAG: hypothetical protein R3C11_06700 [Planctomycetaceae bacterium]